MNRLKSAVLVMAICAFPAMAEEAKPAHSVLLCGSGVSPHYDALVSALSDSLTAKKVSVKMAADSDLTFTVCMAKIAQLDATSMIYLEMNAADHERLIVSGRCMDAGGKVLWDEAAKGPWNAQSLDEVLRQASDQLIGKIEAHVGEKGLEITPAR